MKQHHSSVYVARSDGTLARQMHSLRRITIGAGVLCLGLSLPSQKGMADSLSEYPDVIIVCVKDRETSRGLQDIIVVRPDPSRSSTDIYSGHYMYGTQVFTYKRFTSPTLQTSFDDIANGIDAILSDVEKVERDLITKSPFKMNRDNRPGRARLSATFNIEFAGQNSGYSEINDAFNFTYVSSDQLGILIQNDQDALYDCVSRSWLP